MSSVSMPVLIDHKERCSYVRCKYLSPSLSKLAGMLTGSDGGSKALDKQIEDLTVDLSQFTCEFFRVEVQLYMRPT